MAAFFVSASSQRLVNSVTPITGVPFTIGAWLKPEAVGVTQIAISIADNATTNNYFRLGQISTSSQWLFTAADGSVTNITAGTAVAGKWAFVVARAIAVANRRLAILNADGSTTHGNSTVSRTPAGLDRMSVGSNEVSTPQSFWGGGVAEYWITNSDIQADGAQLDDSLLRQLAYGGPFSVPHVAEDLIEYRSFRSGLTTDSDNRSEVYFGGAGIQTWANTNGATVADHPPLPYWYRSPQDFIRNITV